MLDYLRFDPSPSMSATEVRAHDAALTSASGSSHLHDYLQKLKVRSLIIRSNFFITGSFVATELVKQTMTVKIEQNQSRSWPTFIHYDAGDTSFLLTWLLIAQNTL